MCSAAACSVCWIVIAAAQGQTEAGGNSYKLGIVAVSFFFVFFASFGMGVLGVPWLYPTEINALEMRTKGASLAMSTNCGYKISAISIKADTQRDLQLRGRPSNITWYQEPWLQILDHLGCHLFFLHPDHLFLISRNSQPDSRGY